MAAIRSNWKSSRYGSLGVPEFMGRREILFQTTLTQVFKEVFLNGEVRLRLISSFPLARLVARELWKC